MPSSYPGAIDNFANPIATTEMDDPGFEHDVQHANANDAIEAIETALGASPAGTYETVANRLDSIGIDVVSPYMSSHLSSANHTGGVGGTGGSSEIIMSFDGTLITGTSAPVVINRPCTLRKVVLASRVSSSGAAVVVDVIKTGNTAATSIFPDTNSRPQLDTSLTWQATSGRNISLLPGDVIAVQIVTAGTSVEDLSVVLDVEADETTPTLDVLSNSCRGGTAVTNGTLITTDNSAITDDQFTSFTDVGNGTLKWASTYFPAGQNFSMEVFAPVSTDILANYSFPTVNEVYGRCAMRITGIPTADISFLRVRGPTNTAKFRLKINATTGYIEAYNASNNSIIATMSTAVSTANWFRVEWRLIGGTTGRYQVWLYNDYTSSTPTTGGTLSGAANTSTVGYNEVQYGRVAAAGGPFTFYMAGLDVGTRGKFGTY